MKITFDHNCLIHLEQGGSTADKLRAIMRNSEHQCFIVNVGASEMQRFGVRPDNYQSFERLLKQIGAAHLPRLDPIGIWGVTFWEQCLFAGERDAELLEAIKAALFGGASLTTEIAEESDKARKELNRLCDALTMWCHVSSRNDAFLTTDGNFMKATKLPRLLELGAGQICRPEEI